MPWKWAVNTFETFRNIGLDNITSIENEVYYLKEVIINKNYKCHIASTFN